MRSVPVKSHAWRENPRGQRVAGVVGVEASVRCCVGEGFDDGVPILDIRLVSEEYQLVYIVDLLMVTYLVLFSQELDVAWLVPGYFSFQFLGSTSVFVGTDCGVLAFACSLLEIYWKLMN